MKKLGICLDKLENQDLIDSLNNLSKENEVIPIVFATGWSLQKGLFSVVQMMEAFGHRGNMLCENLTHLQKLIAMPLAKRKFLYITDNEWQNRLYRFQDIQPLYTHPQIELIANSEQQAKILENNWKRPIMVMPSYNVQQMRQLGEME